MNITIRYRLRKIVTHDYGDKVVRRVGHFLRDDKETRQARPGRTFAGPVTIEMPVASTAKPGDLFEMIFGSAV